MLAKGVKNMNIAWINKEKTSSAVTLYNNNITLSKQAASFFENSYGIAVGFDIENKVLVLKKVTKEEVLKKEIDEDDVYELTIKPSFGRINSKKLIVELSNYLDFDFSKQLSYKFSAKWNNGLKMLIVDTKEVSKDA